MNVNMNNINHIPPPTMTSVPMTSVPMTDINDSSSNGNLTNFMPATSMVNNNIMPTIDAPNIGNIGSHPNQSTDNNTSTTNSNSCNGNNNNNTNRFSMDYQSTFTSNFDNF